MRVREWIKRLIPPYLWWPLAACLLFNLFAFYVPRAIHLLYAPRYHDLSLPLDGRIPFVPAFIVFYVGAFVSWYLGYALICREGMDKCGVIFADLIAKVVCMVMFIVLPTAIDRPEPAGSGPFVWALKVIYAADTPADNLFPSIHCLESWIIWRGMFGCKRLSKGVKAGFFVMALLVFAATLLVKQHVIVDIPAAILLAEGSLLLSRRLRLGERFAVWCRAREVSA